ncbi:hypothetical protein [Bartonella grahamii]|nr:hypothetical protein [Bartonella grahamii]
MGALPGEKVSLCWVHCVGGGIEEMGEVTISGLGVTRKHAEKQE